MQIDQTNRGKSTQILGRVGRKAAQVLRQRKRQQETEPFRALPKQTLTDLGVHRDGLSGKLTLVSRPGAG